jgi:2-oxoglutarate dehydrogenase E2 component (dihydrolipoamide succinyltransferase)
MSFELTVPEIGESISEVQIGRWVRQNGETIARDDDLVEIETDKASVVIPAPESGVLEIVKAEGEFAQVGDVIARISEVDAAVSGNAAASNDAATAAADAVPATEQAEATPEDAEAGAVMPAAARLLEEHGLSAAQVAASGPGGRLLKEDVIRHVAQSEAREAARAALGEAATAAAPPTPAPATAPSAPAAVTAPAVGASVPGDRSEEVRPMSMIRRTIARRLVEAQQQAALLTTFNEIDMKPVMDLRKRHKQAFEERHGARLGFMSFFAKAAVEALRRIPAVNAEVRGNEVAYRNYQDIGIAIGGGKGLVVPVLRNVESMSFAQIEAQIADFGARARDNQLQPDELAGGTFTISNGGIYGSLLSTPIVNPPQSGILGMHAIQERPVAIDGEVVIRPMMYVALTYDHRIVDGREAVTFLKTIKEILEDPARLLLEV